MELASNPFVIFGAIIVLLALVAFFWDAHRKGLSAPQELAALKGSPTGVKLSADATAIIAAGKAEFTTVHQKLNAWIPAAKAQPMAAINATFADAWDVALAWVRSGSTNGVVMIDAAGVRSTPQSGTSPAYEFTAQAGGGYKRTA